MNFTPSQQKALSSDRHLAIIANAGSGKTRVLVRRYVDLFLSYPDLGVRNVVAITFTENAATELRSSIQKEIAERLAESDPSEREKRDRLRRLRDSFPSAFIGTIHGFASRILKAYPVEANIDAGFMILQGAERTILEEDALQRTFYCTLEDAYSETNEGNILRLFRKQGRHEVGELARVLLRNRARARRIQKQLLQKSDKEVFVFWRSQIEQELRIVTDPHFQKRLLDLIPYVKAGKIGEDYPILVNSFVQASNFFERSAALANIANKILTGKGTYREKVFDLKPAPEAVKEEIHSIVGLVLSVRDLLAVCPASEEEFVSQHAEYISQLRTVFKVYDQVLEEYTHSKVEYGLLDFDDLIEYLERLLDDPNVCGELAREFRYIMIDEYQDTDESQLELVRRLTAQFGGDANLAMVGDPKQAIYTFRNADVAIFFETVDAIRNQTLRETVVKERTLTQDEERGVITLGETFRMTSRPLAVINRLFRSLLQADTAQRIPYSDLIHARETTLDGRVEWICPQELKADHSSDGVEQEEENSAGLSDDEADMEANEINLIARRIRSIVSDPNYLVEVDGERRRARLDDIAILLRARTNLPNLERALRDANIPYSVAKGTGFFAQPEISDVFQYIAFLANPSNDIALASILRAPFFALSDVELFQIAHHESYRRRSAQRPWSFWDQFQSYAATHHAIPHLIRAANQLQENLALAGRTSTALLIEKIYSETGIIASLQVAPQSAQRIANLEKFLALARTSDTSGFAGLLDFVERIQYLKDSDERESQAELPDANGLVRIMTVHESKGLEFPIVILPFLQKKFRFGTVHLLDKELGLQLRDTNESETSSILSKLICLRAKRSQIEEEKRIFYVATTRARDHLILSCTIGEKTQPFSWLAWVYDAFGFPTDGNELRFQEIITQYLRSSGTVERRTLELHIPLFREEENIPIYEEAATNSSTKEIGTIHLEPLTVPRVAGSFSATQLLRYKECPTKYYLSYVLGMPEEPKLAYDLEPEEYSERVQGRLLGQIVHQLLARISHVVAGTSLEESVLESEVAKILDGLWIVSAPERELYRAASREHIIKFLASAVQAQLASASYVRREFPLYTFLSSSDRLFGILDCLFRDVDGRWTILDYKTDATSGKNLERYAFQMRMYGYLVHLFDPDAITIRALLFFTGTGETHEFTFDARGFANFESESMAAIESIKKDEQVHNLLELSRNEAHCPECRFYESGKCIVVAADQNPTEIPAM